MAHLTIGVAQDIVNGSGYTDHEVKQLAHFFLKQNAPQPVDSPEFTDTTRDALLHVLWHHQGFNSPVGQPIRFALGMGRGDRLSEEQIAAAKRYEGIAASGNAPQPEASCHECRVSPNGQHQMHCPEAAAQQEQPISAVQFSEAQIAAAARALADKAADECKVDRDDNWNIFGNDFIDDMRVACAAMSKKVDNSRQSSGEQCGNSLTWAELPKGPTA